MNEAENRFSNAEQRINDNCLISELLDIEGASTLEIRTKLSSAHLMKDLENTGHQLNEDVEEQFVDSLIPITNDAICLINGVEKLDIELTNNEGGDDMTVCDTKINELDRSNTIHSDLELITAKFQQQTINNECVFNNQLLDLKEQTNQNSKVNWNFFI